MPSPFVIVSWILRTFDTDTAKVMGRSAQLERGSERSDSGGQSRG